MVDPPLPHLTGKKQIEAVSPNPLNEKANRFTFGMVIANIGAVLFLGGFIIYMIHRRYATDAITVMSAVLIFNILAGIYNYRYWRKRKAASLL